MKPDRAVSSIKKMARATFTRGVLADIGSFGAMYQLAGFKKPVLVSSADGVGTKLKVAFLTTPRNCRRRPGQSLRERYRGAGAHPLFFLDYFAVGKLAAGVAASVVSGIARGCSRNGCALIGGETAEMPGMYSRASMISPASSSARRNAPSC
jgi:phosphoribosylformylglycinamidine cyclo-ligase